MINQQVNNTSLLGLFFLYLVLMSSNINSLLGCNVQRLLTGSVLIKHILVFLSIFLFTFILNWFTPSSLKVQYKGEKHISSVKEKPRTDEHKYSYLQESLGYSLFIYALFLLSTKQVNITMIIFLVLLVVLITSYIIYTRELDELEIPRNDLTDIFISYEKLLSVHNGNIDLLYYLHNGLSIGFFTMILNLIVGVYYYYLKQRRDHKQWSWLTFLLGTKECAKV